MQDVVFGLDSLFTVSTMEWNRLIIITIMHASPIQDLLNFDDPLNLDAAEHFQRDKVEDDRVLLCHTIYLYPIA